MSRLLLHSKCAEPEPWFLHSHTSIHTLTTQFIHCTVIHIHIVIMDITLISSTETLTFYCIVAVLLLYVLKCMLGWHRSSGGVTALPCLPSVPVLGSLLHLRSILPPHLLFSKLASRYGPLVRLYMGPHHTLVVSEVTLAREVLLHRGKDFAGRPKMVRTTFLLHGYHLELLLSLPNGFLRDVCDGTIEFWDIIQYTITVKKFLNKFSKWMVAFIF